MCSNKCSESPLLPSPVTQPEQMLRIPESPLLPSPVTQPEQMLRISITPFSRNSTTFLKNKNIAP